MPRPLGNPPRRIRPNDFRLPLHGWFFRHPRERMPNCSWCLTNTLNVKGIDLCPECDRAPMATEEAA